MSKDPRSIVILLLIISVSGIHGLALSVYAASIDRIAPILRHTPPDPVYQGQTWFLEAIIEDPSDISAVFLWIRTEESADFQKIPMTSTDKNTYEGRFKMADDGKSGLEYFIEAVNEHGNKGSDGSREKPYFIEVREAPTTIPLSFGSLEVQKTEKKPFWKKTWFWVAVAAVGGGVAAAVSGGGDGSNTGTVVVE